MATIASKFIIGQLGTNCSSMAGNEVINAYFIDVTAAQLAVGNIFDIGVLPAGHTIGSATLVSDALDSNATKLLALDVGVLSGTPGDVVNVRIMGNEIFAADISARTGVASSITQASAYKILPTDADRSIGVKVQAAAATPAAGRIRLILRMYPASQTTQF